MSFSVTLGLVLAAVYGCLSLLLAVVVVVAWRVVIERRQPSANRLLALRLLPAGGAALLASTVVLPAFLISEPARELEDGGPLLVALALFSVLVVGAGLRRVWRAWMAARTLLRNGGPAEDGTVVAGQAVGILDVAEPLVAVVGGWRPRIVASRRVVAACSNEEFDQVIAHELAHVSARDNLKLAFLIFGPDPLIWLPTGAALAARWRAAAEREADERAAGSDRHKRLALASALVKVARLSTSASAPYPALSMSIAVDDVEARVHALLAPSPTALRKTRIWGLVVCASVVPLLGVPLYGVVHRVIEALVAFGR